uniref:Uncharacterized protein n=1 Tax=Glossina palpalis gambiensis TaxID=67801 RepID=A0A1B0BYW6_9MUSC
MRSIETKMTSLLRVLIKETIKFYLQYTKIIFYISYALYKTVASNELGVEQTPDEYEYKSYLKKQISIIHATDLPKICITSYPDT